jgi:hypothetical protein
MLTFWNYPNDIQHTEEAYQLSIEMMTFIKNARIKPNNLLVTINLKQYQEKKTHR